LPALPISVTEMRRELAAALAQRGVARGRREDIALVVTEAATNVVAHAYPADHPGPLYLRAALIGQALTVAIVDFGRGMRSASDTAGNGYGLTMMRQLTDDLRLTSNDPDAGTSVHARFEHVAPRSRMRRSMSEAVARADILQRYFRTLQATHAELQQDTAAVRAEASQTLAHARRCSAARRS
jgi:anti-sigma regulatory factor (Ser/Thr protein kinase)